MFSSSMTKVAESKGWWQPQTPFDFTRIFSYGEYFSEGYENHASHFRATRRCSRAGEQVQQPPHVAGAVAGGTLPQART